MTMPTYEVSGIAIAAVEAETEVDVQRELARSACGKWRLTSLLAGC